MQPLIITVVPRKKGKFIAQLDGRQLCKATSTPFFVAARVLLTEGYNPETKIIMRHRDSDVDCLVSTVGIAAKLTVEESQVGQVRFRLFKPLDHQKMMASLVGGQV